MGYAIGIDIGTANTRVAVYRNGRVEVIPDKNGRRSMPSYVAFTERCRLFGSAAKAYADTNPESTVYGVKRVLGQRLEQWHVDRHKRISPNNVSLEPPGRMAITVLYKNQPRRILPVQVFGMLLVQARANAEAYLGETVQDAVISLPERFDRFQRLDVWDAAHLVGLNPMYIGTSIESIALYHAFTNRQEGENVYVFLDFGAGFFNAGLVAIKGLTVEVISAASDMELGGEVLIDRVQFHFAAEIQKKWKWDINTDIRARHRLRVACEAAIRELSSSVSHQIVIDSLHEGKDFSGYLSRELLEELCHKVFDGTLVSIDRLFHDKSGRGSKSYVKHARESKLSVKHGREKSSLGTWRERSSIKHRRKESSTKEGREKSPVKDRQDKLPVKYRRDKSSVKEIVIVGGCSRIPKLQEIWSEYFDSKPCVKVVNPDEHEVFGCAIYAANCLFPNWIVFPIVPLNVGLKVEGGMMNTVVSRNTTLPANEKKIYCLSDFALVPHERPILHFYEGNRKRVKDNILICTLDLSELPPKWNEDHSKTKIQITCQIDSKRRVYTSAVLEGKSTSQIAWQSMGYRNKEEMDNLIAQALDFEEDDVKEAALVSERRALKVRLESLDKFQKPAFQTKKMVILLNSVGFYRNWLDSLRPEDVVDFAACHRTFDEVEQGLALEELRAKEISELRSYAEDLRTRLLAATQSPSIQSLLSSVDSATKWVDQNEEAEIKAYQDKLISLMAVSVELVALNETSNEVPNEAPNEAPDEVPDEVPNEATSSRGSTPSIATPQSPNTGPQARINGPQGFNELFPESGWDTKSKYTDAEFEDVASYLRNTGHESWSEVPRIYSVLRLVGQVELVDAFLKRGMTDIWFPFSDNTLPKALEQPHRAQFLQTQEAVFSKALKLERGAGLDDQRSQRKHAHFSHSEPLPFKVIGNLGEGAHGFVDKVASTLSYKEYARKRFKRPLGSAINPKEAKTFLNEVKILKTLCNKHCIDLVGSYSDPRHFALIMHPVADCNLEKYYYLALEDRDKRSILQGFFGCLAGTLDYLHSQKVVHQDIKPQNILVKDNSNVLVTDFGIARSWEGLTRATTTTDVARTPIYAAPEVARGGPKNETADVWSLGCVFLEMCTVLKGQSPADMRAFFKGRSDSTSFHDNVAPGYVAAWVGSLRERPPPEINAALEWVGSMLQVEPRHRCRPFELFDRIVAASESTSVLFCGACCRDRGESAPESNDEQMDCWSEGDDEDI